MSLDCYDVNNILDDDVYCAAKGFRYGLQRVEAYRITPLFNSADVITKQACHVGEVLLCHSFLFAKGGDTLTHPQSLLLFVHSSLFLPVVANHRVRVLDYSVRAVVCALAEIVTASVTGEAMLIGEVHLCPDDGLLLWLV